MYKINIIRSDSVYKNILKAPINDRDSIFTKEILVPFKKKFEVQHMPIYNDDKQTMSAIQFLDAFQISPKDLRMSDQMSIQYLNNDFWSNCEKYLKVAIDQFSNYSISSQVSNYHFTVLLGDSQKPLMYLNKNRGGDGGIPGYIMIYLVPSTSTINSMKSLIAHEVNHNMRYQYIDWDGGSLIELIIAEGLAENYVESLYGKAHIGPWVTNTNWSRDNVKIKNTIYYHLHLKHIFESMPYLYGDDINKLQGRPIVGLSHAAGYACGYHLVKYFLQKTNIPIEVATTLPAQKIINEVTEFWHTHTL
ncbi:TPA: DUF2268 domain-containing protein [Staphylococcus aureus LTCF-1-1]|nr:DUF2268 domain-containing protein [Staphylococcus aureus LTCF-1-1]HDH6339141.1 DUF2268 domain-containing protein [Staphylococcus aureus LTCF-1-2]